MPLKNPKEMPKIPKTRKKKAESAINAIPDPKPDKMEYMCRAFFRYEPTKKKQYYVISVETISEFTAFAYELNLEVLQDKKEIYIVIMGISAKTNMAPTIQPALTEIEFEDLMGEYTVNVVKQDGAINSAVFNFNIYSKEIKIEKEFKPDKKNNRLFCKFNVDHSQFSFSKNN